MLTVLVFLLWSRSITMESQIDRDFQTAVSTQSQMRLLLCKIQTKHCIQVHTEKYQPNTAKYQPNTEKVFKSTNSNFAPISGCSELHIHFYWKYFHKTCFQSAWDDQPRSSDFSFKSNWMFCKIKTAPRFSFLPSQRSGMLAVQLLQTLLHMLFHSRLPD